MNGSCWRGGDLGFDIERQSLTTELVSGIVSYLTDKIYAIKWSVKHDYVTRVCKKSDFDFFLTHPLDHDGLIRYSLDSACKSFQSMDQFVDILDNISQITVAFGYCLLPSIDPKKVQALIPEIVVSPQGIQFVAVSTLPLHKQAPLPREIKPYLDLMEINTAKPARKGFFLHEDAEVIWIGMLSNLFPPQTNEPKW